MDGLTWQLPPNYQFPFGGAEPKINKLQLTNWSNPELEEILRVMDAGGIKLLRVAKGEVDGEAVERLPRRKDRPRRSKLIFSLN